MTALEVRHPVRTAIGPFGPPGEGPSPSKALGLVSSGRGFFDFNGACGGRGGPLLASQCGCQRPRMCKKAQKLGACRQFFPDIPQYFRCSKKDAKLILNPL